MKMSKPCNVRFSLLYVLNHSILLISLPYTVCLLLFHWVENHYFTTVFYYIDFWWGIFIYMVLLGFICLTWACRWLQGEDIGDWSIEYESLNLGAADTHIRYHHFADFQFLDKRKEEWYSVLFADAWCLRITNELVYVSITTIFHDFITISYCHKETRDTPHTRAKHAIGNYLDINSF